jgi:hypothetical protein
MSFRPFLLLGLAACSASASPSSPSTFASDLSAFSGYCTGTLKTEQDVLKRIGVGWRGDGTLRAPAGTKILLAVDFEKWEGYALLADGTPARLDVDFQTGLVKDKDFTSECAVDADLSRDTRKHFVVLAPATLYKDKELTGSPCAIEQGFALTDGHSYQGGLEPVASVGGSGIQTKCGYSPGYTKEFAFGMLVPRR